MPQAPNIQNNTQYVTDGLEIVSNSDAIHTRDDRGNLTLTSGSATNQAVIVENNYDSFTNRSFVNASKTAFNYFKFPPTRFYPSSSLPDLTGILDTALDTADQLLTARYTIPYTGNNGGFDSTLYRLNLSYPNVWYQNTPPPATVDSPAGLRRIPFTGANQAEEGSYTFTPEIIKLLRDTNRTIKFDINCSLQPLDWALDTSIRIRLQRATPVVWRPFQDNEFLLKHLGPGATWPNLRFQYVVDIDNINEYDKFIISAVAGNPSWMGISDSYWNIAPIENGSEQPGFAYENIPGKPNVPIWVSNTSNALTVNGQPAVPGTAIPIINVAGNNIYNP